MFSARCSTRKLDRRIALSKAPKGMYFTTVSPFGMAKELYEKRPCASGVSVTYIAGAVADIVMLMLKSAFACSRSMSMREGPAC